MFVLVNGIPMIETNIHRDLKQGDPLVPFLLMAEGFSGLMRNLVSKESVSGVPSWFFGGGGVTYSICK
ncbi:putative non-LTR retroelement reverse transcriptase [Trifolium medium]|uniref:Putative non-LTR retroelement reverse transcriptase n=1 Tax=Trifolium medium TaxID=97028 RepID=A0A392UCN4_9FABA|nr:putative non-LTR retroelement reverse transcriptase [Trifolium medium]